MVRIDKLGIDLCIEGYRVSPAFFLLRVSRGDKDNSSFICHLTHNRQYGSGLLILDLRINYESYAGNVPNSTVQFPKY